MKVKAFNQGLAIL